MSSNSELHSRIEAALLKLGADPGLVAQRELPVFADATNLTVAYVSKSGQERLLSAAAASAWARMHESAASKGVTLIMISGFRSFDRQLELIEAKLAKGHSIEETFRVLAPPGCSEHHSGRAIDIGTPGCEPLSEHFEKTAAFEWLQSNAAKFDFRMSYPRNNRYGYLYEPWHWCHGA